MFRSTNINKTSIRVTAVVFALAATIASSTFGQEPDPTDAASVALLETVVNSLGVLVDSFGCNTQAAFNYNGRITPGEGWTAHVQGLWGDTTLALNYFSRSSDGLHYDIGGGGFFGTLPWATDSAQAAFADSPPFVRQIGLGDARILFAGNNPDWHWWKRFQRLPDGRVIDWGAFEITRGGTPRMTYVQSSYTAPRIPGQPSPHAVYATGDWQTTCEFLVQGTTTEGPSGSDISGTVTLGVQGRQPPCPGGVFSRIVGTTTECPNHRLIWVNTLQWYCPPDNHVETSVERVETDTPC
jgi:hypothetical protein